ncbi:MAG: TIGR03663 family protein [Dehalococcoidia bacterium]|nr:TIGR03663 family protein [Dehalococcoidia bacterium]
MHDPGGKLPLTRIEVALFLAIAALALLLRFWQLDARTFHGDEAVHAGFAWQLADGRGYEHNPLTHGPFQFFATALVFVLFGDSDFTARLLPALFGAALAALPFLFRGQLGRVGALVTSLMLAVSPTLLYFSRFARNDIYIALFTFGLVICIWRFLAEGRRLYLYLTAALLALSFAAKEVTFITVGILLVYLDLLVTSEMGAQMGWRPVLLPRQSPPQGSGPTESPYAVLGVPEGARHRDVRRAYRRLLAGRKKPSKAETRRIEKAYRALSGPRPQAVGEGAVPPARPQTQPPGPEQPAKALPSSLPAWALLLPVAWLIVALWPLLGGLRRRLGLHVFPRAGHPLALMGCLSLPLLAATVESLPFVGDRGYDVPAELAVMRTTVLLLIAASFIVGFLWRWRVWMICSALFYTILISLYTSFFTNADGFWSGAWGSLDYWLGQQGARLGDQPSYYYFMLLPVYEFLPLCFALGAALVYVVRGERRHKLIAAAALAAVLALALVGESVPLLGAYRMQVGFLAVTAVFLVLPMASLTRFLFYWTLAALFAFTLAGEKMPWLNVHIALPLCILAGKTLGDLLAGIEVHPSIPAPGRWLLPASALAGASAAIAFLVWRGGSGTFAGSCLLAATLALVAWSALKANAATAARVATVAVAAGLLVLTVRAGVLSSWGHPGLLENSDTLASRDRGDTPVELLAYVQPSPDILLVRDAIDRIAAISGQGTELPIVIDARDSFNWPWAWYLRKYENLTFVEDGKIEPPSGSVALVSWRNRADVVADPALFGEELRYHHRWWFPEEYRGFSSADILRQLFDLDCWDNWARYFIDRTPPGGLPAVDAVAYFPRDDRVSEVLSSTIHKER